MSGEQLRLIPARDPGDILRRAIEAHDLSKIFVGFSGGKDSTVTLDYMWANFREYLAGAYHIRTGISAPDTITFAARFCREREIPFTEIQTKSNYEDMVREHGFPGPAVHNIYYNELKDDPTKAFIQSQKTHFNDHIGIVTGIRAEESKRRGHTARDITQHGATVWIAPLIDWSNARMLRYREECKIEMSEAARTLCMSGDCLCGSKASTPDEINPIELFYPQVAKRIHRLEDELRAAGHKYWQYGNGLHGPSKLTPEEQAELMPQCVGCAIPLFGNTDETEAA